MPIAISAAWAMVPSAIKRGLLYIGIALVFVAAAFIWLHVHDANIRNAALTGYVKQVELTAAQAKAATEARRAEAANAALEAFRKKTEAEAAAAQVNSATLENEINEYEKKLAAANRQCRVSDDDAKWLRKH